MNDATSKHLAFVQLLVVPGLYYLGVKASLLFAATPDVLVMLWIPNSFLLATLMRCGLRRFWLLAIAILAAEVAADFPTFSIAEALLFGGINLTEALIAFSLLRRWKFDADFTTPADLAKFVSAGPLIAALFAAAAAGGVYSWFRGDEMSYLDFARVWWFSDGLGVLILTPVTLSIWKEKRGARVEPKWRWYDVAVLIAGGIVLAAFAVSLQTEFRGLTIRPALLMLFAVYVATRFSLKVATGSVLATALVLIYMTKVGRQPFGPLDFRSTALSTQEYIATMSLIALGLSTLLSQHRANTRELESRVRERTSELQQANAKLERLALTDALTSLPNRRALLSMMAKEFDQGRRMHQELALVMFDVDHFKKVNDTYGHAAGDQVLQHVARQAASVVRQMDTLTRYGGEEFVLLSPAIGASSAMEVAERMRNAIKSVEINIGSQSIRVTASFGIAVLSPEDHHPHDLLRRADRALYAAKNAGRDCAVFDTNDSAGTDAAPVSITGS